MTSGNIQEKKKLTRTAAYTIVVFLALVLVLILYGILSLGWFAKNEGVQATGMSVSATAPATLRIYKSNAEGAEDIGLAAPAPATQNSGGTSYDADLNIVTFDGNTDIGPGSSGSITAWVEYCGDAETYQLTLQCLPVNNEHLNIDYSQDPVTHDIQRAIDQGFYDFTGMLTDEAEQARRHRALLYLSTHIAMFQSYDAQTEIFSGWIPPEVDANEIVSGGTLHLSTDANGDPLVSDARQPVTLYWRWINDYTEVLPDSTAPIAQADRAAILTHMQDSLQDSSYNTMWFSPLISNDRPPDSNPDTWYITRYNAADMYIATTIACIRMKLAFDVDTTAVNP